MKQRVQEISLFLVGGAILHLFEIVLKSNALTLFLQQNIITLLIALLAINIATIGTVALKLRAIVEDNEEACFDDPVNEMRYSVRQQIVAIVMSVVVFVLAGSEMPFFEAQLFSHLASIILCSVFVFSIFNLSDTSEMVFQLLRKDE